MWMACNTSDKHREMKIIPTTAQTQQDWLYILLRVFPYVSVSCDDQSLSIRPQFYCKASKCSSEPLWLRAIQREVCSEIQHLAQAGLFKSGSVSHMIVVTSLHRGIQLLFPSWWFTTHNTIHQGRRCPWSTVVNIPLTPSLSPSLKPTLDRSETSEEHTEKQIIALLCRYTWLSSYSTTKTFLRKHFPDQITVQLNQ